MSLLTSTTTSWVEEVRIPGSFVVLQGVPGDGMRNTMDILPEIPTSIQQEGIHTTQENPLLQRQPPVPVQTEEVHLASRNRSQSQFGRGTAVANSTASAFSRTTGSTLGQGLFPSLGAAAAASSTVGPFSVLRPLVTPNPSNTATLETLMETAVTEQRTRAAASNSLPVQLPLEASYVLINDDRSTNSTPESEVPRLLPTRLQGAAPNMADLAATSSSSSTHRAPAEGSRPESSALQEWQASCRQTENFHRREWLESCSLGSTATGEEHCWWMVDGCLSILDGLPRVVNGGHIMLPKTLEVLYPGSTVVATALITLRTDTFSNIDVPPVHSPSKSSSSSSSSLHDQVWGATIYPSGRDGWLQLIKINSPRDGYVVYSRNGYSFMAPGEVSHFTDPQVWMWRVSCAAGAFVREGLDLSTRHIETLPYGSLVRVHRKTINTMGLSRLQVSAVLCRADGTKRLVEGWCSELLNPLSGQRGPIVQPLPFPVPALYRVTLKEGAVIRQNVELSSRQVGVAPHGTILRVSGKAYSEHPADKCIERLRLVGNGGWISLRLNKSTPEDHCLVEHLGIDGSFDPKEAGQYHLQELYRVRNEITRAGTASMAAGGRLNMDMPSRISPTVSSIGDDDEEEEAVVRDAALAVASTLQSPGCQYFLSSSLDLTAMSSSAARQGKNSRSPRTSDLPPSSGHAPKSDADQHPSEDERCLICLCEPRTATVVHGETGHIACCLLCARILKARNDPCPVCRLPIDLVVQHFFA